MGKSTRYERVRATRCRKAYRWVRGAGYLIMFSGLGIVVYDKTQGGSTGGNLSELASIGYLCFIIAFIIFAGSYGLYIAIRAIESKLVQETGDTNFATESDTDS